MSHHHRPTTKSANKAFKSRHATKSALKTRNKGKVDETSRLRHNHHQQLVTKLDRRNRARQLQANKHKDLETETRIFRGRDAAPRVTAIVPLCDDVDASGTVRALLKSLDVHDEVPETGAFITWIERFKQRIQWVTIKKDLLSVLDACKAADFVVFVTSPLEEVDAFGHMLVRSVEAQGVSNTVTVVQGLNKIEPPKRRPDIKKSLLSWVSHFFPTTQRIHDVDSPQEAQNVIRSLCTTNPRGVHWRDDRSYLVAEELRCEDDLLIVAGVVRGRGLKADRLVHIQGFGDFQVDKICAAPLAAHARPSANVDEMAVDSISSPPLETLDVPSEEQDDLLELAPEEADMQDAPLVTAPKKGVLLDDHYYFDDDLDVQNAAYEPPKNVPKGTSDYQSAWYIPGENYGSDDGSEASDDEGAANMEVDAPRPEDGEEGRLGPSGTEYAPTEVETKSEMFLDPSPDDELAAIQAFRSREKAIQEDREFPDEIELHPHVVARERLVRYRGLKSLRTSRWEASEDKRWEPEDWSRLVTIENYKQTKQRVLREALIGGISAGKRVLVYLRSPNTPPSEIVAAFDSQTRPLVLWSLLRHEHKQSIVSVSITPSSDAPTVKSKEELILQVGSRRMHINPLFSQAGGTGPNNVTKFERFLLPGRTSIATFIGPLTWGSVPVIAWRRGDGARDWEFVGTGSFLTADKERVIAKRIVLTGHPYKIHKRLVTVRYMFFNREDANWFKAMPLYTKRGRSGFIKESLGTHGYFKATFDGRISPQDAVAISLYKRVFPRGSTELQEF